MKFKIDENLSSECASLLGEAGFAVEQAADGKEGLYYAEEYPIDLAIIDLGLPGMSGLEIIERVRAEGKTYPILILTARDRWEDKVAGLEAGADEIDRCAVLADEAAREGHGREPGDEPTRDDLIQESGASRPPLAICIAAMGFTSVALPGDRSMKSRM